MRNLLPRTNQEQMQNQEFFLKYKDNQAVKINTHFNGEHERRRPLTDVADLVAAAVAEPTRRLLGLPDDYGPLTLHLPEGVGREGLDPSCFDSADSAGTTLDSTCSLAYLVPYNSTSKKLLIIKSKRDNVSNLEINRGEKRMRHMEVDCIPGEHLFWLL
jgi:hypothetical protein